MDMFLLRFLERLAVVSFGGMAIYLGYRLFINVPTHKDSSGKLVLPWNISVVLTRVGPGVFFALFGVIVVSLSLMRPVEMSKDSDGSIYSYGASVTELTDPSARADGRALLRKEIGALNTFPEYVSENLPKPDQDSIKDTIRQVKLKLMKPVWGQPDQGFGEFSVFEQWVNEGESDPPPSGMEGALTLYRYLEKAS